MGEMCDFEAEYYPGAWASPYGKNGKKKARKDVYISMNAREYAQYKAIGGAVATRKLVTAAAIGAQPKKGAA